MYKKHVLKNGLRVITMPMTGTETVTVMLSISAGSRYEESREQGLAHFLEHLAFKGTKKRPSALAISRELDAVGAEYNAFTSKEVISFYTKVDRKHAGLALDIISDMLTHALLDAREIEREKGVILEEMHMYQDTPMRYVGDLFEELMLGSQSLGRFIIGTEKTIRSFAREDMMRYQEGLYRASNVVVTVAGRLDHAAGLRTVEKFFGRVPQGVVRQLPAVVLKPPRPRVKLHWKETDQTHLILGVPAYPLGHPSRYALDLLSVVLGGGMSSRLFLSVRERSGLAYYVRASSDEYRGAGLMSVSAGVTTAKLPAAIRTILRELSRVRTDLVPPRELQKAKDYVKGRTLISLESSDAVASWGAMQEALEGRILTVNEVFRRVDKVTPREIKRVARDIFRNRTLGMALVGPFKQKDEDRFEKLLKM